VPVADSTSDLIADLAAACLQVAAFVPWWNARGNGGVDSNIARSARLDLTME